MRSFRMLTAVFLLVLMGLPAGLLISACGGTSSTTAQTTTTAATTAAAVSDWSTMGFSTVLGSMNLSPGQASTVTAGPYTFQVPAGAFTVPVRFEVLSQSPGAWTAKVPSGMKPVLAFALKVTNQNTGQLIGSFDKIVPMTVKDPGLTAQSMYYNISASQAVTANTVGLQAKAGALDHPLTGALYAWVITSPAGGAGTNTTTSGAGTSGGNGY